MVNLIKKQMSVVGLKNGYKPDAFVPASGYRDFKLLVKHTFHAEKFKQWSAYGSPMIPDGKVTMICEIQLILREWLECKKGSSLPYKVRRAADIYHLAKD